MNNNRQKFLTRLALLAALFLIAAAGLTACRWPVRGTDITGTEAIDVLIEEIEDKYYKQINRDALIEAAVKGMFTELDPYSTAYTAAEYQAILASLQGEQKNFGFSVQTLPRRPVSVYRVTGNSPAERAGVRAGDEIVGIRYEGENHTVNTAYLSQSEVFSLLTDGNKPRYALTVQRLKPAAYQAFTAESDLDEKYDILNDRNNYDTVTLGQMQQESYNVKYVYYYMGAAEDTQQNMKYAAKRSAYEHTVEGLSALPANVAYIKVTEFSGGAGDEFAAAMAIFKSLGKQKLILDLRDNPGGTTTVLGEIASYLLYDVNQPANPKTNIFSAKYRDGRVVNFVTPNNRYVEHFGAFNAASKNKIAVLLNGMSASASEALSCAVQDYETGTLVGTTTYKKGIMQSTYYIESVDYYLKVTVAAFYSPVRVDFTLHDVGLLTDPSDPNYVEDNFSTCESCRRLIDDAQVQRALSVLG